MKIRITTWTTFFYDSFRVELKTKKKAKTTDNRATARLVFRSQMVKTFYRLRLYLQRTTKFVATVHNTLNTLPVCEIRFGQLTGKFKNYIRARARKNANSYDPGKLNTIEITAGKLGWHLGCDSSPSNIH